MINLSCLISTTYFFVLLPQHHSNDNCEVLKEYEEVSCQKCWHLRYHLYITCKHKLCSPHDIAMWCSAIYSVNWIFFCVLFTGIYITGSWIKRRCVLACHLENVNIRKSSESNSPKNVINFPHFIPLKSCHQQIFLPYHFSFMKNFFIHQFWLIFFMFRRNANLFTFYCEIYY